MSDEKKWLRKDEAANWIGVTPRTIDRLAAEGKLTRHKIDGVNASLYLTSEIDALVKVVDGRQKQVGAAA